MTTKTLERRKAIAPGLELRDAAAEAKSPGTLTGYAAVFNSRSEELYGFYEIIKPGAFKDTIGDGHDIYALADHDVRRRLARTKLGTLKLAEDDKGLRVEIALPDTDLGREIAAEARQGLIDAMSFGFFVLDEEMKREDGDIVRIITKVELLEVSTVTWPAYPATSVALTARDRVKALTAPPPAPPVDIKRLMMRARLAVHG